MNTGPFDPKVSWLSRSAENLPEDDIPVSDVIRAIKTGKYARQILEIRSRFARALERTNGDREAAKKAVEGQKKRLPCATFSGVFGMRANKYLKGHSGLICADLDLLAEKLDAVRASLAADEHVFAIFKSPTGDGLKVLYRVPVCANEAQHKTAFRAVAARVREKSGVQADDTPDSSRLCYVSYDAEAFINPAVLELPVSFESSTGAAGKDHGSDGQPHGEGAAHTGSADKAKIEQIVGPVRWHQETSGFCECPGKHLHTNQDGEKDCRIKLGDTGNWYLYCVHTSCAEEVKRKNAEVWNAFNGLPPIENAATLIADASAAEKPAEIIEGILHKGSKAILGSSSKARKTWILIDLGLSVASGTPFWLWKTTQGRVCYINFEIQRPFIHSRITALVEAKELELTALENLDIWNLRGHAASFDKLLPQLITQLRDKNYSLVIIDPVYKGLGGRDENAAGDVAQLCNEIERVAVQTGAAVVFAAHYSKGNQAGRDAIDRISGSGVFARDADTIINLTKHEVDGCLSVDLTLRNFLEHPPFVVRWKYPLMTMDGTLNPEDLKRKAGRKKEHCPEKALEVLSRNGPMTIGNWKKSCNEELGIKERSFYNLRKELEGTGSIRPCPGSKNWEACKPRFKAGPSVCFPRPCPTNTETATTAQIAN